MRRLFKAISGMLCAVVLFALPNCLMTVNAADNNNWVYLRGEEWSLKDDDGTNITAKIKGRLLHIQGTGAIPDFSGDAFGKRPWNDKEIYAILIDDGITSIGANAFTNFKYLHDVTMNIGTFIEDPSAFNALPQGTIFYINGMNIIDRSIGTIPYTNIDYLTTCMQQKNNMYQFRVANHYIAGLSQSKATPKIENLSQLDVKTDAYNPNYPLIDYTSSIKILSGDMTNVKSMSIISCMQGREAIRAYAIAIGDNQYATAYNITVSDKTGPMKQITSPYQMQITVPPALRYPGRQFTLIQLGQGTINMLTDEDTDDATITFTTTIPSSSCALVYKDTM